MIDIIALDGTDIVIGEQGAEEQRIYNLLRITPDRSREQSVGLDLAGILRQIPSAYFIKSSITEYLNRFAVDRQLVVAAAGQILKAIVEE